RGNLGASSRTEARTSMDTGRGGTRLRSGSETRTSAQIQSRERTSVRGRSEDRFVERDGRDRAFMRDRSVTSERFATERRLRDRTMRGSYRSFVGGSTDVTVDRSYTAPRYRSYRSARFGYGPSYYGASYYDGPSYYSASYGYPSYYGDDDTYAY